MKNKSSNSVSLFRRKSGKNFLFTMVWFTQGEDIYKIFLYNDSNNQHDVKEIASFKPNANSSHQVPRFYAISTDGTRMALQMFNCWQCDGHIPDTLLFKIDTKESKRIGEVSYFKWKDNEDYEYKENKVIPCPTITGHYPCYEDPSNLPTLNGTF